MIKTGKLGEFGGKRKAGKAGIDQMAETLLSSPFMLKPSDGKDFSSLHLISMEN